MAPSKTTLVWSSSNKSVATVSSKGKITAKGVGEAVITCYAKDDPDICATVMLSVTKAVTGIKLDKTGATVSIGAGEDYGKTYQLKVKSISPSTATDKTVMWTSSNESVATVDQNGLVTSVGEGTATIKVTAMDGSGKYATCKVTVKPVKITSLKMSKKATISISAGEELGKTLELDPVMKPSNPYKPNLTWKSSKTSVATVDQNGVVTSVGPGTATITCKDTVSGKSATCKVTVQLVKITSLKLPKSATISIGAGEELGKTLELDPVMKPSNPYKPNLTWKSSKTSVATVDQNGVVTSVGPGTATITCKDTVSGKSATCKVTVKLVKITSLKLPKTATISIGAGEELGKTLELNPVITPDNPYAYNLVWTSSKTSVVTVDENGVVTSVAAGTAKITCKDTVSGKSVTCKITVKVKK